jgi:hypothetical protein
MPSLRTVKDGACHGKDYFTVDTFGSQAHLPSTAAHSSSCDDSLDSDELSQRVE